MITPSNFCEETSSIFESLAVRGKEDNCIRDLRHLPVIRIDLVLSAFSTILFLSDH
jgi:hypothetical protein